MFWGFQSRIKGIAAKKTFMRKISCPVIFVSLFLFLFDLTAAAQKKPLEYVNVFTGMSNSRWQLFPGATMPFGLVKLSPDNQGNVWSGGYEYTVGSIGGFSHLHAMALSGLSLMPTSGSAYSSEGTIKSYPGSADGGYGAMWTSGYRSRFKRETERGSPGYYSVELLDYGVKAEMTATMRCGMMRLTYPTTNEAHLILNFDFPTEEKTEILETRFDKISATEVSGFIRQKNNYAHEFTVYFVMQLNTPVVSADAWQNEAYQGADTSYGTDWRDKSSVQKNISTFDGKSKSGVLLNFAAQAEKPVVVRTGISMVSLDGARNNLQTEMKSFGFDFDGVVKAGQQVWSKLLEKVEVSTAVENDKEKFYTNLYRAYTGKSVMNDVDGKYVDACHGIQQLSSPDKAVYTSDALWGTQWNLTPLWTLLNPDIAESWANAYLELADKGGWIPYAPVALGYSPIMGAQHQNSLIISAYQKGIRGFDAQKAYKAILHDYTTPGEDFKCGGFAGNRHLKSYQDLGYVADEAGPASNTMEYAYDDWCFAQFAKALGKTEVAAQFQKRSLNYKNQFDPSVKFIRRRHADGTWVKDFDPLKYGTEGGWNGRGFMEGNAYQYSFFVPQDVAGMIDLMGRDTFNERLEKGFADNLFDPGNQPSLALPFLFNYSGKPWLTQHYSRRIAETMYDTSPYKGWTGEEDEGQMSSLFVLLAMGLFEVDGGCAVKPFYNLSSPIFDKFVIQLDNRYYKGKTFTVIANNNSPPNEYIQSAKLNGKPIGRAWITHEEIVSGGTLELTMGAKPNTAWGLEPPPTSGK